MMKLIFLITSMIILSPLLIDDVFGTPTKIVLDDDDFQIVRSNANTSTGSGNACDNPDTAKSQDTVFEMSTFISGSITTGAERCRIPIVVFDITNIPDTAWIINATFALNVTASSDTLPASSTVDEGEWQECSDNVLTGLTDQALWDFIFQNGANECLGNEVFDHSADIFAGIDAQLNSTQTSPSSLFHTGFEAQLESGNNFYNLVNCPLDSSANGCTFSTNQDGSASATYDEFDDTFLQIWYDTQVITLPPQLLTAVYSSGADKCTVDWEKPIHQGARPIEGWHIDRRVNGGAWSVLVADSGSGTPTNHVDTTIISGEDYEYRVFAINPDGESPSASTSICSVPSVPDPPTGLTAIEQPDFDITLNWVAPVFTGGASVTGYFIERSDDGISFGTVVADTQTTDTTFIDTVVSTNIEYTYRISSINSVGTGSASSTTAFEIIVASGGGSGSGGQQDPVLNPEPELTQEEQLDLLEEIAPDEGGLIQSLVSQFFEFAIVDVSHDELLLSSLLQDQRLGIRWSSGQDILITSAVPAPSPFLITFEQFPVIKEGSGAVVSTNFLLYNLQVPSTNCVNGATDICVENARYEVPVTINGVLNGTVVSDVGTITVDLVDELVDPILLMILALAGLPIIAGLIQRNRNRSPLPPTSELLK